MKISSFVKKAVSISGKVSAETFIKANRSWICLFPRLLPVLAQMDTGAIFPTAALNQLLTLIVLERDPEEKTEEVVLSTGEVRPASPKQVEAKEEKKRKDPRRYQLVLLGRDSGGFDEVLDFFEADDFQSAQRLAYRKLFHREDSVRMSICSDSITTYIGRDEAMREILNGNLGGKMATKRTGSRSSGLTNVPTVKNFRAHFSRG